MSGPLPARRGRHRCAFGRAIRLVGVVSKPGLKVVKEACAEESLLAGYEDFLLF